MRTLTLNPFFAPTAASTASLTSWTRQPSARATISRRFDSIRLSDNLYVEAKR
jgi:hypothetical protein